MTRYSHFAFRNLFLLNGYQEIETHRGIEHEYPQEDGLEHCIRRLVLRRPERLSGWDLRFLRRGLNISQGDFGIHVDRDAQTVARWEKTRDAIPKAVDLTIRTLFAARFESQMSIKEILSYVDGRGAKLPAFIYLRLTNQGWQFELEPTVRFAHGYAFGDTEVRMGPSHGLAYRLIDGLSGELATTVLVQSLEGGELVVAGAQTVKDVLQAIQQSREAQQQLKINIKGSAHDKASATIH